MAPQSAHAEPSKLQAHQPSHSTHPSCTIVKLHATVASKSCGRSVWASSNSCCPAGQAAKTLVNIAMHKSKEQSNENVGAYELHSHHPVGLTICEVQQKYVSSHSVSMHAFVQRIHNMLHEICEQLEDLQVGGACCQGCACYGCMVASINTDGGQCHEPHVVSPDHFVDTEQDTSTHGSMFAGATRQIYKIA